MHDGGGLGTLARSDVIRGACFIVVAFFFFARGLDEDNDYLRLNHGLWHVFSSIAFHFFLSAKVLPDDPPSHNMKVP
jgi:predicted membrane channel-forming protein YqfA (hemolysin III family)